MTRRILSKPPGNMVYEVARVLPPQARNELVRAANIDPNTPRSESQARTAALDQATRSIKAAYPKHFKEQR